MNFFQMPNFLWDREDLDVYERVILAHIIRRTVGWGKNEDGISLTQFQASLGISKSSVIRALKKLIEKRIISKKSTFLDNGSKSFNIYFLTKEVIELANKELQKEVINKIDEASKEGLLEVVNKIDKIVNEIDKGSVSQTLGQCLTETTPSVSEKHTLVSERDIQNTLVQNTLVQKKKEKNIKKEKNFCDEALEDIEVQVLLKELQVDKTFLQSLIAYREKIKPIKTLAGLKKVLKDLRDTRLQTKKSVYELFEIMQENEWLTIKTDYIKPKKDTGLVEHNSDEAIDNAIDGFLKMTEGMEL